MRALFEIDNKVFSVRAQLPLTYYGFGEFRVRRDRALQEPDDDRGNADSSAMNRIQASCRDEPRLQDTAKWMTDAVESDPVHRHEARNPTGALKRNLRAAVTMRTRGSGKTALLGDFEAAKADSRIRCRASSWYLASPPGGVSTDRLSKTRITATGRVIWYSNNTELYIHLPERELRDVG